jgi:hypothetical protein
LVGQGVALQRGNDGLLKDVIRQQRPLAIETFLAHRIDDANVIFRRRGPVKMAVEKIARQRRLAGTWPRLQRGQNFVREFLGVANSKAIFCREAPVREPSRTVSKPVVPTRRALEILRIAEERMKTAEGDSVRSSNGLTANTQLKRGQRTNACSMTSG